jgi:thioredoxin 1
MLSSLQGLFGKSDSSVAQPISTLAQPTNNKGEISVRTPDEVDGLEKAIKVGPVIFVFVHADWCGHCRAAQAAVAHALAQHTAWQHVKVEDGAGRALGRSFRVKLWPTLVLLRDGQEVARLVRPTRAMDVAAALSKA